MGRRRLLTGSGNPDKKEKPSGSHGFARPAGIATHPPMPDTIWVPEVQYLHDIPQGDEVRLTGLRARFWG